MNFWKSYKWWFCLKRRFCSYLEILKGYQESQSNKWLFTCSLLLRPSPWTTEALWHTIPSEALVSELHFPTGMHAQQLHEAKWLKESYNLKGLRKINLATSQEYIIEVVKLKKQHANANWIKHSYHLTSSPPRFPYTLLAPKVWQESKSKLA